MVDNLSPEQRRKCMSRNKGCDTKPELLLRSKLWRMGLRFRTRQKILGNPDISMKNRKISIFVDGCFWHGCKKHATVSKTRQEFWRAKLARNRKRDAYVTKTLRDNGWIVVRVWEHEIKEDVNRCAQKIMKVLS